MSRHSFAAPIAGFALLVAAAFDSRGESADFEIPFDAIAEADRDLVRTVVENPTIATYLGKEKVAAPVELYEYLLEHLDFTGKIVRRFDLGDYDIRSMGPGAFHVDDGDGAVADVRLVHDAARGESGRRRVYLARGYFEVLDRFRVYGDAVILLDYAPDGEAALATDAAIRFRARSDVLDRLSRLARRTLGKVVKSKAALFVRAAKEASELAAKDPEGVGRELDGKDGVDEAVLGEYRTRFSRR